VKFNLVSEKVTLIALFLFFFVLTIGMISTSSEVMLIVEWSRAFSLVSLCILLFVIFIINKVNSKFLFSCLICGLFFLSGSLLSIVFDGLQSVTSTLIAILIIIVGVYLLSIENIGSYQPAFAKFFVVYSLIVIVLSIFFGGLVFTPVPSFVFDYISSSGSNIRYSQGVSQFFGYSALAASTLIINEHKRIKKNLLISFVVIFVVLSLLGGARGDSIFALLLVLVYFLFKLKFNDVGIMSLIILIPFVYIFNMVSFEDIVIVQRLLSVVDGVGYGHRDILLGQSIELLSNNPTCIIHGCGFGYFQRYFEYPLEMYPHNALFEIIIVFGFPITCFMCLICFRGLTDFVNDYKKSDIFLVFFIYSFLLSLKSGTINTNWIFMVFFIFFVSFYFYKKWNS
jgi:hypothetical protein